MAKATIQSVLDLGFKAEQFDSPVGFDQAGGYVDVILGNVGMDVADAVGDSYATAANVELYRIEEAEKYLVAAELLRRIPNYQQAKLNSSRSGDASTEDENKQILKRADDAENTAYRYLRALGVDTDGGIASGFNEHDHFSGAS